MTTLREAAQQALEILERLHGGCTDSDDGTVEAITIWCPEIIDDLRAALAEEALQRLTDVQQEMERNFCPRCGKRAIGDVHTCTPPQAEPAQERFCDTHCTWADHAPGCVRAEPLSVTVTELQEALVYTNLIDRDAIDDPDGYDEGSTLAQIDALHRKLTAAQGCNPHPKAPHGFLRNASHTEDRYVCECEYWDPYEAGYQAGMEAALRAQS